jgi:hypothetical protein
MFVSQEEIDHQKLLQGDVLVGVQLIGAINLGNVTHLTPTSGKGDPPGWTVLARPIVGDAMVLSHSCELDRSNTIKVTSIILAPLRDVSTATAPEKILELKDSNLIDRSSPAASYLKYFYIERSDRLSYGDGAVVDFSKCFSIRNQSYDLLLTRKTLQLTPPTRFSMSLKLALYFHRDNAAVGQ